MGVKECEATIIECGEADYAKHKKLIYDTFTKMMNNAKSIPSANPIMGAVLRTKIDKVNVCPVK